MKIFNKVEKFEEKVNFVDKNNVVVGYDLSQSCCEDAGWILASDQITSIPIGGDESKIGNQSGLSEAELEKYVFCTDWLAERGVKDEENWITFRLNAPGNQFLYLMLFNVHNGYYSHGFDIKSGDTTLLEGLL